MLPICWLYKTSSIRVQLPWVHDPVWIHRIFQPFHHVDRPITQFLSEIVLLIQMHPFELCLSSQQHGQDTYLLPDPNPVLASTRPAKLDGPMDHSVGGCIRLFKFAGFKNDTTVKVAIAYMPIFWKKKISIFRPPIGSVC